MLPADLNYQDFIVVVQSQLSSLMHILRISGPSENARYQDNRPAGGA